MKKKIDKVYQYLPYSAFKKMIQYRTIKLSNIKTSNDTTELKLRFNILKEAICDAYDREKPKYMSQFSKEDFLNGLIENTDFIDKFEDKVSTEFVSCFSEKRDLLSQWRGYSQEVQVERKQLNNILNNGNDEEILLNQYITLGGVSVGFSLEKLEKITKSISPADTFTIGHVEYSRRKQKALFRKEADSIVKQVRAYVKANKTIVGFDWNQCRLQYHHALLSKGAYIKHPFFFEEKEWRICLWG